MKTSKESHTHREILLLLPWYANDTLNDRESARVENHIEQCHECRQELALCWQVQHTSSDYTGTSVSTHNALATTLQRIDSVETCGTQLPHKPGFASRWLHFATLNPVEWRIAIPALALLWACSHFAWPIMTAGQPQYGTLSDANAYKTATSPSLVLDITIRPEASRYAIKQLFSNMGDDNTIFQEQTDRQYRIEVVSIDPTRALATLDKLRASDIVSSANIVIQ